MDPLNKQERTEAFIKMSVLFLLAVIIVAIPMYYAFQLPAKEQKADTSEFDGLKSQMGQMKQSDLQFVLKTDSAIALYNEFSQQADKIVRDKIRLRFSGVSNGMEDFSFAVKGDSVKPRLYSNTVFSFTKLFSSQNEIFLLKEQIEEMQKSAASGGGGGAPAVSEDSRSLMEKQRDVIKKSLEIHSGNRGNAARELGMSERVFRLILKEYKME